MHSKRRWGRNVTRGHKAEARSLTAVHLYRTPWAPEDFGRGKAPDRSGTRITCDSRLQPSYTASGDGGGTSPVATLGGSTVADCGTTVPYSVVARSLGRGKIPDGSGTRVKHDRVTKGLQPSYTASGDGGGTSSVATRRKHGTTAIIYPVGARGLWARADPGLKRYWCQA